ncbi:MAG: DnaJ domain-containing protein [Methylococcaceae bacterium]|jgi:DnaJ-class molecular chaperone
MALPEKDFYTILGLSEGAEPAVIKAAYKALIMLYHPDRYIGDQNKAEKISKNINEAYAVLIDPVKRKNYDAKRIAKPIQHSTDKSTAVAIHNELKHALQESEAILNILNRPD